MYRAKNHGFYTQNLIRSCKICIICSWSRIILLTPSIIILLTTLTFAFILLTRPLFYSQNFAYTLKKDLPFALIWLTRPSKAGNESFLELILLSIYNWTYLFSDNYSRFHKKGNLSVHSFNGVYLSISKGTGSCGYLFMKYPVCEAFWFRKL